MTAQQMTAQQMTDESAPAQQQQGKVASHPAKAEAPRTAPQQMQAAAPAARFTDWAAI